MLTNKERMAYVALGNFHAAGQLTELLEKNKNVPVEEYARLVRLLIEVDEKIHSSQKIPEDEASQFLSFGHMQTLLKMLDVLTALTPGPLAKFIPHLTLQMNFCAEFHKRFRVE